MHTPHFVVRKGNIHVDNIVFHRHLQVGGRLGKTSKGEMHWHSHSWHGLHALPGSSHCTAADQAVQTSHFEGT